MEDYVFAQNENVSFKVRLIDNYIDATQLASCLNMTVGQWRAGAHFQRRLDAIKQKTNLEEKDLFQARKKHATFVHPLLALDLINTSRSPNKKVASELVALYLSSFSEDVYFFEEEQDNDDKNSEQEPLVIEKAKSALTLDGVVVIQRESDGMINLTAICKAGKKLFKDWQRQESAHLFLEELAKTLKCSQSQLMCLGQGTNFPTYGHPDVAINVAQWVSPKFNVMVTQWIRTLLTQGYVALDEQKITTTNEKELEYKFAQLELEKQKFEETQKQNEETRKLALLEKSMDVVTRLSGGTLEVHHNTFFKEVYLNLVKNTHFPLQALTTQKQDLVVAPSLQLKGEQITLAIVAAQKGYTLETKDLIRLGKRVSQKYEMMYGQKPQKHTQMHHGRSIPVNTFFECDRALLEETIDEMFSEE